MIMTSNNTPLPPGQELDVLVAEKLGWKDDGSGLGMFTPPGGTIASRTIDEIPNYSTDIAAAWRIVKYLDDRREDRDFSIELIHLEWEPFNWQCDLRYDLTRIEHVALAVGVSVAHAICLAFLAIPELV
jgi:hypothetical protein